MQYQIQEILRPQFNVEIKSVAECYKKYGMGTKMLYIWLADGDIDFVKIAGKQYVMITETTLKVFADYNPKIGRSGKEEGGAIF